MNGLYYYKLVSEYPEDVTKNCKLTINEIDSNFKTLKDNDIKTAEFVRGKDCTKADGTLVLKKNNGEKIIVPLDVSLCKNLAYDLNVTAECGDEKGQTLTISYKDDAKDEEGKPIVHTVTIENIITSDNLNDVIGSDILTKVISDATLSGLGTMKSPLGIAGVEKTGMLAPAAKVLDLTDGSKLPSATKKGTRYVTKEYVNDYGYLYNGNGVEKIKEILDKEYNDNEIYKEVDDRKYYWRVPSKADWDALLNSIEPCGEYKNHNSAQCHIELGKYAGKFLKSECGWVNSIYECDCDGNRRYSNVCNVDSGSSDDYDDDYTFDNTDVNPKEKKVNPVGIDKYGMKILPTGIDYFKNGTPRAEGFGETTAFWTTTILAPGQDTYIKVFDYDKSGVYQVAECPLPYYAVRLVKDYDGSNYHNTEYIDGVLYECILMPESGQIWLASNFADKNGFATINDYQAMGKESPDVLDPNNGQLPTERRTEMFINEYNGRYWEKRVMNEGDTIVIQNPCYDITGDVLTEEFCWIDGDGYERCITVEIPTVAQSNVEYRVYKTDDGCDKELRNTDDLVVERVLSLIIPMIDDERWEREKADVILSGAIDTLREDLDEEISARTAADEALSGAIDTISGAVDTLREDLDEEISARTAADEALSGAIDTVSGAVDDLREDLEEEIERAISAETEIDGQLIDWSKSPFEMTAAVEKDKYNLELETKDGNPEHTIKIQFNGDFGKI